MIPTASGDAGPALRRAVLALAGLSIAGIAIELVIERHWGAAARYIPWLALLVSGIALVRLARRPTAGTVRAVRLVAIAVLCMAAVGIALHARPSSSRHLCR